MTDSDNNAQAQQQPTAPNPALKQLDKLLGTWTVTGPDIEGRIRFEWMDGGFFLMQHVDIIHGGRPIKGIEFIGFDAESQSFKSHFFGNQENPFSAGNPLEYVWELSDDTLTIWGGYVGSPARYKGTFSADGNTNAGAWKWPGGGYESTMTRIQGED